MSSAKLTLSAGTPACHEYTGLRDAARLSPKTMEAAERGLPNSLFAVCVRDGQRLVGMGRVVGDGGCNFEIVDVAVHPACQRQGVGTRIMEALMDYLRQNAPPSAYVSLMADEPGVALYERFGFEVTAPATLGMAFRR